MTRQTNCISLLQTFTDMKSAVAETHERNNAALILHMHNERADLYAVVSLEDIDFFRGVAQGNTTNEETP
jgi:hypothetical protein